MAQRPIFTVSVPVRKGEAIPYALVMSLEPDRLVEILKGESLPPGWRAAVYRNNINIARTQFANQYLGHPIPDDSVRQYAGRTEGVIETIDFEGQRSLHAFHWSRLTGWHVTAWAPFSVVEGQLRQAWVLFFWSGAVLLSLSVLLAFGAGRLMAAPITKLMHAGAALGEGKPLSPIHSTLREADELSLVLSNAANDLHSHMGAQAHLAAIVTSSPSAVVSLSHTGNVRAWNAAAARLFGYQEAEVMGRPMAILEPERWCTRTARCDTRMDA